MARLEKPILPTLLHRYRALNNGRLEQESEAIRANYIWCSVYKNLNDPMEGYYRPSARLKANQFSENNSKHF